MAFLESAALTRFLINENFQAIVRKGPLTGNGMSNFGGYLGERDVADLQNFIFSRAEIVRKK
ncbi:MAG: hypothetical protein ABIN80_15035 [Dyadobacter sp.]|uniref:hypothetical protein n=1 Tax=Dyadobacter sp. TaxID=1914288 RepID=UPI003263D80C